MPSPALLPRPLHADTRESVLMARGTSVPVPASGRGIRRHRRDAVLWIVRAGHSQQARPILRDHA